MPRCSPAPGLPCTGSPAWPCRAPVSTVIYSPASRRRPPCRAFGPSPRAPSGGIATKGEVTEEEYVAREERFADYVSSAVKQELGRTDWDLLIVYVPLIDGLEHRYLLDDPRQVEFGDEDGARRKRFAQFIERAYRKMDAMLASWL